MSTNNICFCEDIYDATLWFVSNVMQHRMWEMMEVLVIKQIQAEVCKSEPAHEKKKKKKKKKTHTKNDVRPAKTQLSLGIHRLISLHYAHNG